MAKSSRAMLTTRSRRFPIYLVPIVVGIGGVLVSQQVPEGISRLIVILLSLSVAVFAAGNIIGRLHSTGIQRYFVLAGVMLLTVGALVTASPLGQELMNWEYVPPTAARISRWLGLGSLFVGLCAILVLLMRREELTQELAFRFSNLAEHIREGFVLSTAQGRIIMVNQRFLDMTGLKEEMVVGHDARDLAVRFGIKDMLSHIDLRPQGIASEYQIPWNLEGEERQLLFSGTPIYDRRGERAGVMATVRDVTEQHRLSRSLERYTQGLQELVEDRTRQLRQSEERLRELLVHMNEGFVTIDKEHRIQFANNRVCAMLDCSESELIGRSIFDFVDTTGRVQLLELLTAVGSGSVSQGQHNLNLVTRARRETPAVAAVARIQEGDGPVSYSLVITDVSELRTMQKVIEERAEELQRANEELRQLDRTKDTFLTNVTHELRTPLSTVRGYIEMMRDGTFGELEEKLHSAVNVMYRNADRLAVLIDEMIEFSRMEILGIQLSVTLFDPRRLVDTAVGSIRPVARPKGIEIVTELAPDLPMVWGDRKRLEQLLGILLNNAVKFSHPGGRIEVRARSNEESGLSVTVKDDGIGIKPEDQNQVFRKFFQADSSLNRRYEGAGIGLPIAKSIADAHHGRIDLESAPNKGSAFTLVLPNCCFEPVTSPGTAPFEGLKVLVIDEDPGFRRVLCDLLEGMGCAATPVRNGYEAVRIAAETQPAVVLLDEVVDDLTGRAVVSRLREQPETFHLPAVIFASEQNDSLRSALDSQVYLLEKPFDANALHTILGAIASGEEPAAPGMAGGDGSGSDTRPHVLVLDDDEDFLDWMVTAMARRRMSCVCTNTMDALREHFEARTPAAVIIDLDAFGAESDALVALLQSVPANATPRVVGLTAMEMSTRNPIYCDAILKKPFSIEHLVVALSTETPAHT